MSQPSDVDLEFLRSWMERPAMGAFPLCGLDRRSWDEEYTGDLIVAKHQEKLDPFSRWFNYTLVPAWHRTFGEKLKVSTLDNAKVFSKQFSSNQLLESAAQDCMSTPTRSFGLLSS